MAPQQSARTLFRNWIRDPQHGAKFQRPVQGRTNYVGGQRPFPTNPAYVPVPPLSQEMRNLVVNDRIDGLNVRQISERYQISIPRVDAILKLAVIEQAWQDRGEGLLHSYSAEMENMLQAVKPSGRRTNPNPTSDEPITTFELDTQMNQHWVMLPETEHLSPSDAAQMLKRKSLAEKFRDTIEQSVRQSPFSEESDGPGSIAKDTAAVTSASARPSRFVMQLRDTSNNSVTQIDQTGVIRRRTASELNRASARV